MWLAILFDLDDTLYAERDYVLSGFTAVARRAEELVGIPVGQGYDELAALFQAGVRGDTFNRWLAAHGIEPAPWIGDLLQAYREHEPHLTPFPGMPALLQTLRQRYRLGLLSDGYLDVQRRKLAALGLQPLFDVVVFSDTWGRDAWKPSRIPYDAALGGLEAPGERAVYVGDNPRKDFLGARQLGIYTVRLRQAGAEYAELEPPTPEHAPHTTVADLAELQRVLLPEHQP